MAAVVFILSIVLPRIGQYLGRKVLFITGGFSIAGLLAATIILMPLFISGMSRILERIYGITLGNEGWLVARNMRGNKNINQNIILLFISISAIIAIGIIVNFVQVYVGDVFNGAKLDGFTDAPMTKDFVSKISQLHGIDEILPVHVLNNQIFLDGSKLSRVEATADIREYADMFAITYGKKQIDEKFNEGRNILLASNCMKRLNIKTGDTVSLSLGSQSFQYFVLGSYKTRATNKEAIISSYNATQDFGAESYGLVAYTSNNPEVVMVQIRDLFGNKRHWSRTVKEFNDDAFATINAFLQPMKNLTWFIFILAIVGIINNLLINHIQKRHTIAIYKSVGMSNSQQITMTLIESFSVGLMAAIIAIIVSLLEIKTIFLVAGPKIAMQPELELGTFLFAGALGIGITLIGSVVPIIKSKNMKIVDELKFK
ncbi:ABC transporter permease [Clostridium sp. 'deep sea']|uniref:ABC transporter permease n=1 Tax=Clostridium sp. 'deep sea' TaxID=2779445 RepID=UPI00325FB05C